MKHSASYIYGQFIYICLFIQSQMLTFQKSPKSDFFLNTFGTSKLLKTFVIISKLSKPCLARSLVNSPLYILVFREAP